MIRSLHIRNYILIDSLDIDFSEGLQIITGSTGAGKSILLGAISLLMGSKADASVISDGEGSCVVEADFATQDSDIKAILEAEDIEWNSGGLTIRRVVHNSGRSRSFINDQPVTVSVLTELTGKLTDIHSQHQSLLLTDKSFRLSVLDDLSADRTLPGECRQSYRNMSSLRAKIQELEDRQSKLSAEREYNAALADRLESAHLRKGEMESLELRQKELANAEEIKGNLTTAQNLLSPESMENRGVIEDIREARKALQRISPFIPQAGALAERMESVRIELSDIQDEITSINARTDIAPDQLEAVEERMSLILGLMQKHSCSTEEDLIALRDHLKADASSAEDLADALEKLRKEQKAEEDRYHRICASLHKCRTDSAAKMSAEIERSLHYLELEKATFTVKVSEAPEGPMGTDTVDFLFDASGKKTPMDIAKCASGGELSRIMLCLKSLMSGFSEMPTMIFDEIDTGVSGSVADKMGSMICRMGEHMQVFAITHLPQVAAKGNAHYLVEKKHCDDGTDRSGIKRLSPEERVLEIARMLSGSSITDAAIANAESLLG